MTESSARSLARELGGEPVEVIDQNWHVVIHHSDGRIAIISDIAMWEYADEQAFRDKRVERTIPLGPNRCRLF
jgi:hypothetical protein